MSSSWERVAVTRMCATCAREFEHTPNPNGGRQPLRCPRCRGENKPPKKAAAVALVAKAPASVTLAEPSAPPPASKLEVGAVIAQLEQQGFLIADAVRALRALREFA